MTTVAYRNGVLAADTQATNGDTFAAEIDKLHRYAGGMAAFCGRAGHCFTLLKWVQDGRPGEQPIADGGALIVVPAEGEPTLLEDGHEEPIGRAEFFAWGSGRCLAMGAMAAGATPQEAIAIAIRYDINTGGEIAVLRRDEAKELSPQSPSAEVQKL